MATFKHISSKNADYGAAEQYLTFEHDEFTMKPTLDGNGRLVLRDDYRISSLNCGGEDFAIACMRSNLKYGKNQKREDVKSHHYIISFDPRDATDNGLSVDRAQQLGEQFCKEHFPGHQALVCTHPDGHNHSGNIHVHIVINSLRIAEVPLLPYMERPADTREGCKHRCTDAAMEYFKAEADIYFKCKGKKPLTEAEQILFTTAKDYLKGVMNGKTTIPTKAWKEEYTKLTAERKTLNQRYLALKEEVKEAEKIRKNVYGILRQEQREQQTQRKQDMER